MVKTNWNIVSKEKRDKLTANEVVEILLEQRGIKTKDQKEEFFNPIHPYKFSLDKLKISEKEVVKATTRLKTALNNKEQVYIYGDYDADGVCATALLWQSLYQLGFKVLPYIPERFSEGYGINTKSVKALKVKDPDLKLIITVDNGIVAQKDILEIKKYGIDVIVTDHHDKGGGKKVALATVHTTEICGSALAWVFVREVYKSLKVNGETFLGKQLDLVSIGTIADQVPLTPFNRSFAKHGLEALNKTTRVGLLELIRDAALSLGDIRTYEVGYVIAPRINAMGRLTHAIESLRLLCYTDPKKVGDLSRLLTKTNLERQKIVEGVVKHAREQMSKKKTGKVLILGDSDYHEGVIGLAAGKLTEEFFLPAIVFSKGKEFSKASARSIPGFNIIENVRKLKKMLVAGGGHPMAAGFTIKTKNLKAFIKKFEYLAEPLLTEKILTKSHKVDLELGFDSLSFELIEILKRFEPFGIGNFSPSFIVANVSILKVRTIGQNGKHLKLLLKNNNKVFDAVAFGKGELFSKLKTDTKIAIIYSPEENIWNGERSLQIKIKDLLPEKQLIYQYRL
jgi:single-stranded-DNA-specific exonuclease